MGNDLTPIPDARAVLDVYNAGHEDGRQVGYSQGFLDGVTTVGVAGVGLGILIIGLSVPHLLAGLALLLCIAVLVSRKEGTL